MCWHCAEPSPSHVWRDRKELFFTDAAPDHSLGVSSKHRAPHPSHSAPLGTTRQPKASMDRWSDHVDRWFRWWMCPWTSATTPWWFGFQSERYSRRSSQRSWDHGGIHSLDVLKYMVLLCLNYIVLRWTILLPHCPSHKLGSKSV